MVFSSLFFLYVFLPLNLVCYFFARTTETRNKVMILFSLIFYVWGEPVYVLLLLGMTFADWAFAILLDHEKPRSKRARLWLVLTCVVNLGLLGVFKYGTFTLTNLHNLFGFPKEVVQIALPIGISFYTFQLLSYVADVYRGEVQAQRRFSRLLLYVSLFHQCIAGPIVRYQSIERELTSRRMDSADFAYGITRFTTGLAKKAVLANACGAAADALTTATDAAGALATLAARPALSLWVGAIFYMLQIYLDFSAYSDMAIGMGRMLGFHYLENFNYPYIAKTVKDFWGRWHISLSTFFRDYVYIPLGGSRCSKWKQIRNLLVVWALTGLWHGASWNFVLWGLYYFVFLLLERESTGRALRRAPAVLSHLYLLVVVYFGWILFRYSDFSQLGTALQGMFGLNHNSFVNIEAWTAIRGQLLLLAVSCLACTPIVKWVGGQLLRAGEAHPIALTCYRVIRTAAPVLLLLLATMSLVGDSYNPFLYFQF